MVAGSFVVYLGVRASNQGARALLPGAGISLCRSQSPESVITLPGTSDHNGRNTQLHGILERLCPGILLSLA